MSSTPTASTTILKLYSQPTPFCSGASNMFQTELFFSPTWNGSFSCHHHLSSL
jgi:hypothetical protein